VPVSAIFPVFNHFLNPDVLNIQAYGLNKKTRYSPLAGYIPCPTGFVVVSSV